MSPTKKTDTRRYQHLAFGAILLAVAFAVYSGGFGNNFIENWDDALYVSANPDIQQINISNLQKIFTSFYVGNYAPLQMLSYMFDYALWGRNPTAFFTVNLLLHALNGILLYRILCRLKINSLLAFFAALLFVVHPVQVESVAWISQRKNVLSIVFLLSSCPGYPSFTQAKEQNWKPYLAACLFFACALLTKAVVVILPAALLVYDFTLREKKTGFGKAVIEKIPFAFLAAPVIWVTLISQGPEVGGGIVAPHGGSAYTTSLTMLTVYKEYLYNLFWPMQLSAVYHIDIKYTFDLEVIGSLALLLLTPSTLFLFRPERRKEAAFWLAFFFIAFLPVSQIIPIITLMNDRYCYMPLLGFAPFLCLLGRDLAERWNLPDSGAAIFAVIILLLLAPLSWQRTTTWSDMLTLWQDAVVKQPESAEAWSHLGYAREFSGQRHMAIECYHTATKIKPDDPELYANIGILQYNNGNYSEAISALERALRLQPDHRIWLDLALSYTRSLQHKKAINLLYEKGGNSEAAITLLAINYYHLGEYRNSFNFYRKIQVQSKGEATAEIGGLMALVAKRQEDNMRAESLWRNAITAGVKPATLYLKWARLEAIGNQQDEALKWIEKALQEGRVNRNDLYADPDFENLRGNEMFLKMLKQTKGEG